MRGKKVWIKQKKKRVNESTSCLSVNDLVRLNARIYEILHINSNIGFCFTRQKNVKKTHDVHQTKRLKTDQKKNNSYCPEGKLRKKKISSKCAQHFSNPFSFACLNFSIRISIEPNSKIIISAAQWKKTIPKPIIFIFQRWRKKTHPRIKTKWFMVWYGMNRDSMQTKLRNQKWTCVHNCSLREIYIGPNQTISLAFIFGPTFEDYRKRHIL